MSILTKSIIVESGDGHTLVPAEMFVCGECKGNLFVIFTVANQEHPHLQCVGCDASYCNGGKCGIENGNNGNGRGT